jgi:uncharacterized protein
MDAVLSDSWYQIVYVTCPHQKENNLMKLRFGRWLAALLLIFIACELRAESSVWVVKSALSTVYLAGSCHVLRASDHPLPVEFAYAYQTSRRIVLEAPLSDMEKPEYLAKLAAAAIFLDGTTLRSHISAAAYAKVAAFCKKRGYPLEQYQMFRPWMLSMTLTMMEMARIGAEPSNGVDQFFFNKAAAEGKTIGNLETVDEQIGFLSLIDASMGNEQIIETVAELEKIDMEGPEILAAWKKGDEARIAELNLKELKDYPKLYQALFIDRNKKWLRDIEGYLRGGENTMVIVGVAHLAGENSVVDLLRQRGYKVAKLKR